ncbi:MAG: N-acetylmuramoyl-L-alanine amidase [Blastochloris sp.]|nr:N-acetylmuramoyl-L-alanine amidase [Blastochloris sp.]
MFGFKLTGFGLVLFFLGSTWVKAAGWEETKIGSQPYVTFESFCAFYQFTPAAIPEKDPFEMTGAYGKLQLTPGSRDARWNGRRIWLSFPFVVTAESRGFISKLDVIKLFDPLIRRKEMAPRRKLEGVIIDAGHGGTDNGASSRDGFFEKTGTLDTAKRLKALLDVAGIPNKMTRSQDEFILLEERASIANKNSGWIFVSLHYNSGPSHAHGVETYALTPQFSSSTGDSGRPTAKDRISENGNANDALNLILADSVHQEITRLHSAEGDRGLKRARFVVLRKVKIPGVLVEGGFLTHKIDARLISSGAYRQKIAQAVANAVQNYRMLMLSSVENAPTTIQPASKSVPLPKDTPMPAVSPSPVPTTPLSQAKPVGIALEKRDPAILPTPTRIPSTPVSEASPQLLLSKPLVIPVPPDPDTVAPIKEEAKPKDQPAGEVEEEKKNEPVR